MNRHNSTIKVKCKCSPECELPPTMKYEGYNYSHAPEDVKTRVGTKRQLSNRNRAKRSEITKKAHLAQREVLGAKIALKRQKQKPIPKTSKKMLANLKIYSVLRKDYLKDHPICECGRNGCKRKSQDIHHKKGRGIYLNVIEYWLAVARVCHTWINEHPKEAMFLGLTVSRLKLY